MTVSLLSTKLHVPRPRVNGVMRPRLTEKLKAARLAFMDVPRSRAVVVADWSKENFRQLPYPKWGKVVFA